MNIVQFDFSKVKYIKLADFTFEDWYSLTEKLDKIITIVPIYEYMEYFKNVSNIDYPIIKRIFFPNIFQIYNYNTNLWESLTILDYSLLDRSIIGVYDPLKIENELPNINRVQKIIGCISYLDDPLNFYYIFNEHFYLLNTVLDPSIFENADNFQWLKLLGEFKYWQQWAYDNVSHKWITTNNVYALSDYYINSEVFPLYVSFKNGSLLFNSNKTNPLLLESLDFVKLPTKFVFNNFFVDYKIENQTINNAILFRIKTIDNKEWVYSDKSSEWQYIGQPGGDFPVGSNFYNTIEEISLNINKLNIPNYFKIKMKVISDSNNIEIYRILFSYTNTEQNNFTYVKIYGNIKDIIGSVKENVVIYISPLLPQSNITSIYHGNGIILTTDFLGNFETNVLSNSKIVVSIPVAGLRLQIDLQNSDVNLGEYIKKVYNR